MKLHLHGMEHSDVLLAGLLDDALSALETQTKAQGIRLHYVTAREAYNLILSAKSGKSGSISELANFYILPPPLASESGD